nr:hypothetical protein Iba_scaffold3049CG0960 [Ipomoea batatas]GME13724.1 hypothetical protein Iba_scaffold14645CG0010 [Ipomoea batatas]
MARRAEGEKAGGSGRSNYNYSSQRPSDYGAGFEASSNPITLYRYYPQQAPLVCFNPAASVTEEEMASQESSSRPNDRRARKGKAPIEGPSAYIPKEEDEELPCTLRVREEVGPSRIPPPSPQVPRARPLTPSSSSTSPTEPPCRRTPSSSYAIPPSSPDTSTHVSISSTPVVQPPKDLTPPSSSLFHAHFIKVTDWESMQVFQNKLHLESLKKM